MPRLQTIKVNLAKRFLVFLIYLRYMSWWRFRGPYRGDNEKQEGKMAHTEIDQAFLLHAGKRSMAEVDPANNMIRIICHFLHCWEHTGTDVLSILRLDYWEFIGIRQEFSDIDLFLIWSALRSCKMNYDYHQIGHVDKRRESTKDEHRRIRPASEPNFALSFWHLRRLSNYFFLSKPVQDHFSFLVWASANKRLILELRKNSVCYLNTV